MLALAPYPENSPSTRFRLAQFREPLAERGVELRILPFFTGDEYERVAGDGSVLDKVRVLARAMKRRRNHLREAGEADLVLIHRGLAPILSRGLLQRLLRSGVPLVFDFDDAVFLPAQGGSALPRLAQNPGTATAALCRAAALVLAGNAYLASFARDARGRSHGVEILPTVIDTVRYRPVAETGPVAGADGGDPKAGDQAPGKRREPTVGWIGTRTTIPYLEAIYPELEEARQRIPFRLLVVSDRAPGESPSLEVAFRRWSPAVELEGLRSMDVGLYPLPDDRWTRGKCGFKAIQYMACGVPVLGSPVGVLEEMILEGETGVQVREPREWTGGLLTLLREPSLRRRMGRNGRARVVERYSVQAVLPKLERWLRAAATKHGQGDRS